MASERSATTRAATSASRTIDAVERLTRLSEGMAESLVLQREILLRLHEVLERLIETVGGSSFIMKLRIRYLVEQKI